MRRVLLVFLIVFMFTLTACSVDNGIAPSPEPGPAPISTPVTTDLLPSVSNSVGGEEALKLVSEESDEVESEVLGDQEVLAPLPEFDYFKGVVDEIVDSKNQDWDLAPAEFLMVVRGPENAEGYAPIIHAMGDYVNTFIDKVHLGIPQVGDEVVVFFRGDLPMTMIYPPQYRALAIVKDNGSDIVVSRFDADAINTEKTYKINLTEDLVILGEDGLPYELTSDLLDNRAVIAFYDVSTRSMPAQINPNYIIVLGDYVKMPPTKIDEDEFLWSTNK